MRAVFILPWRMAEMLSMMVWCGGKERLAGALIITRGRRLPPYRPVEDMCLRMPVVGEMETNAPVRTRGITGPPPARPPAGKINYGFTGVTRAGGWPGFDAVPILVPACHQPGFPGGWADGYACNRKMGKDRFRGLFTVVPLPVWGTSPLRVGMLEEGGETLCRASNSKIGRRLLPIG